MKRGSGLTRRTGLPQGKPLAPGKGLTRSAPPPRAAPLPRQPAGPEKPSQRPARRTGNGKGDGIPRDLAAFILERAEGCCDWCGRWCLDGPYSRQHRLSRSMGGRAGANTAENLILLCGTANSPGGCHLRAEHDDIPAAREAGFRLRDGQDPALVPILRHGNHLVYPTAEGWIAA